MKNQERLAEVFCLKKSLKTATMRRTLRCLLFLSYLVFELAGNDSSDQKSTIKDNRAKNEKDRTSLSQIGLGNAIFLFLIYPIY